MKVLTKKDNLDKEDSEVFSHYGLYTLLLSCIGEKYRSIDSVNGIGIKTLEKMIMKELNSFTITKETESIELLSRMFDGFTKDCVEENYQSISLKNSIKLLLDGEKKLVLGQIEDRIDLNSLMQLNNTMFHSKEHELRLESLLK